MDGGSRYALPRWPGSARDRPASGDSRANGVSLARVRHSLPPGAPFQSTSSGPREWRGSVNETRKKDLLDVLQRCQNFEKKALGWSTEAATTKNLPSKRASFQEDVFGDYRILQEIGRGGMGVVYLAEQISLR